MNKTTKLFFSLLTFSIPLVIYAETITVESDLDIDGILTVGNSEEPKTLLAGSIRWTGTDIEGFDGSEWKSLTQSSDNVGVDQTLSIVGDQLTISGAEGNTVTLPSANDGIEGQNGATWLTGAGVPDDANGANGDLYLDTSDGNYYVKTTGTWGSAVGNLNGPQGETGNDGAIGPQGPAGASPFVLNGSDVHYMDGNIGIGVNAPGEALDVSGNVRVDGAIVLVSHSGDIPSITYE